MVRIAYLGPEGTFTEAALVRMVAAGLVPETGPDALQRMPVESAPAALAAVRDGGADYACVPIENSIDGSVLPTLDSLAIGVRLQVFAETTLDVTFSIVVKPGRNAADVRTWRPFRWRLHRCGSGWRPIFPPPTCGRLIPTRTRPGRWLTAWLTPR